MYDIKYVDGKPVKVEIDEVEELKNELHKDNEPENAFDIEKRALYANTPKAKMKMDRSLTARSLSEASTKLKSLIAIANEACNKDLSIKIIKGMHNEKTLDLKMTLKTLMS